MNDINFVSLLLLNNSSFVLYCHTHMSLSSFSGSTISSIKWSPSGRYLVYIANNESEESFIHILSVSSLCSPASAVSSASLSSVSNVSASSVSLSGPFVSASNQLEHVHSFGVNSTNVREDSHAEPGALVQWTRASVGEFEHSNEQYRAILATVAEPHADGGSDLMLLLYRASRSMPGNPESVANYCSSSSSVEVDLVKNLTDELRLRVGKLGKGKRFSEIWIAPKAEKALVKIGEHSYIIDGITDLLFKNEPLATEKVKRMRLEDTSIAHFSPSSLHAVLNGVLRNVRHQESDEMSQEIEIGSNDESEFAITSGTIYRAFHDAGKG